jgi:hypothetical protein
LQSSSPYFNTPLLQQIIYSQPQPNAHDTRQITAPSLSIAYKPERELPKGAMTSTTRLLPQKGYGGRYEIELAKFT